MWISLFMFFFHTYIHNLTVPLSCFWWTLQWVSINGNNYVLKYLKGYNFRVSQLCSSMYYSMFYIECVLFSELLNRRTKQPLQLLNKLSTREAVVYDPPFKSSVWTKNHAQYAESLEALITPQRSVNANFEIKTHQIQSVLLTTAVFVWESSAEIYPMCVNNQSV